MVRTSGARPLVAIRKGGSKKDIGGAMTGENNTLRSMAETLFFGRM
jgi:hypothetical protein